jgi:hypothetical protein
MPDIHPLTLADRSLVSAYLNSHPPEISEHTFTNLFIWQPSRPILFSEIENSLVFLVKAAQEEGKYILLGPPVGKMTIPDVVSIFGPSVIGAVRIPDLDAENLPASGLVINPDPDNADYVYRVKDLAELNGRRYATLLTVKPCRKTGVIPEIAAVIPVYAMRPMRLQKSLPITMNSNF